MKDKQSNTRLARTFGVGLIVTLSAIGGLQMRWGSDEAGVSLFALSSLVLVAVLLAPSVLMPLYWLARRLSRATGFVMTLVLLCLVFYLAFAPIGIAFRLVRYDVLDRKFSARRDSYWQAKSIARDDLQRYERQY